MFQDQHPDADAPAQANGNFRLTPPQVSLPKGGGAIRSMGEKFSVNAVTGTSSLTVPITLSPGRSGFGPSLSLSYDSGAGNGCYRAIDWNSSGYRRWTPHRRATIRDTQLGSACLRIFNSCARGLRRGRQYSPGTSSRFDGANEGAAHGLRLSGLIVVNQPVHRRIGSSS